MGNYKNIENFITFGGQIQKKEGSWKIKYLYKPTFNNAIESCHDSTAGDYKVPTGKILRILQVDHIQSVLATSDGLDLMYGPTANSVTGTTTIIKSTGPANLKNTAWIDVEIPEDQYINAQDISNVNVWCLILGVEINA